MMLRIFKTSQPLSWILITLILFIVRLGLFAFFFSPSIDAESFGVVAAFSNSVIAFSPWLSHLSATLVIILSGFFLNSIGQNINLFKGIHYLLFLIFGLFATFYPENLVLTPFIISLPVTLFSLNIILTQSKGSVHLPSVYNAAFLIGLSSIIYFPSILYLILLLLSLLYLNQIKWRHLVLALIGLLTPWLFYDVIIFSFHLSADTFIETWNHYIGPIQQIVPSSLYSIGIILVLIVFQSFSYLKIASRSILKIRKTHHILFIYLLIGTVLNGFLATDEASLLSVIIVPTSILFTSFYLETKKWWLSDLLFVAFLVAIGLNYYLAYPQVLS